MRNSGQQSRIEAHVAKQFEPWAEDRAIAAWRALDSFTMLSAAELRYNRKALYEMRDMIERAVKAIEGERE